MATPTDIGTRLDDVRQTIGASLRAVESDPAASPVTVAVVREFDAKAGKAGRSTGDPGAARDAVIELEQAGDSAKAAAGADEGLGDGAREAVDAAHLAICILKTEV